MQTPENGTVEKEWIYRGRQLRLVRRTVWLEGEIWEKQVLRALTRFDPLSSLEMAAYTMEQHVFGMGPLPLDPSE